MSREASWLRNQHKRWMIRHKVLRWWQDPRQTLRLTESELRALWGDR